jgi:hypothetical protein
MRARATTVAAAHSPRWKKSQAVSARLPKHVRRLSTAPPLLLQRPASDPRIRDLGREIWDDYAALREHYGMGEKKT